MRNNASFRARQCRGHESCFPSSKECRLRMDQESLHTSRESQSALPICIQSNTIACSPLKWPPLWTRIRNTKICRNQRVIHYQGNPERDRMLHIIPIILCDRCIWGWQLEILLYILSSLFPISSPLLYINGSRNRIDRRNILTKEDLRHYNPVCLF